MKGMNMVNILIKKEIINALFDNKIICLNDIECTKKRLYRYNSDLQQLEYKDLDEWKISNLTFNDLVKHEWIIEK